MAGVTAELKDKELRQFLKALGKIDRKGRLKEFARKISAPIVFKDVMDHFAKEMGPDGKWKEWSPRYADQMEKKGKQSNKILQDGTDMRQQFKPQNYKLGSLKGSLIWLNSAETEDGFPYAYAHDNDEEPRSKLPQRSFMWLSDSAMNKIAEEALAFAVSLK